MSSSSSSASNQHQGGVNGGPAAQRIDYNSLANNFQHSLRMNEMGGSPVYGSMRVQGQVPQGMMRPAQGATNTMPMMRGSPSHSMGSGSSSLHSNNRASLSGSTGGQQQQQQVVYENLDYYGDTG